MLQGTKVKVLKLDRQLDRCIHRDLKYEARQISSTAVSIENYKNQIFRSNFTHIHVYVFRISFLTTLNIYKDYFKGRQRSCKLMKLDAQVISEIFS